MLTTLIASAALLAPAQYDEILKGMVPVGKPAPAFTLEKASGGKVSLAQAVKGKKATIINFWFYG